ncbi:MAG: hypothetical protein LBT59_13010 [Clostridiales bacterium]|jgi:hypothetical protein|nr:hypothetical protein [Clostridiales bacterium]
MDTGKDIIKLVDNDILLRIVKQHYKIMNPFLNERSRRQYVAAFADVLGYGGAKLVSEATGVSKSVIVKGHKELLGLDNQTSNAELVRAGGDGDDDDKYGNDPDRIRRLGGGRFKTVLVDEEIRPQSRR